MLCDYYKDGYCRHHTGSNGSRQLPCIFNTHDSRIEKCKYQSSTGVCVEEHSIFKANSNIEVGKNQIFKPVCNKPNCPGVTNCSCNWRG